MNAYDSRINAANDLIGGAISVAASKKEYILKQGANIVLLFIVLAVFGCLDFATLTFHPEYIFTPSYWGTVITKVVAGVCSFNIGINLMLDGEIRKNKILADLIDQYAKLKISVCHASASSCRVKLRPLKRKR